jgi:uncharacterized coiled-coil protein SlyX
VNPVHYAAASLASALAAAVSFAVDGPTMAIILPALGAMTGAIIKGWKASVAATARTQILEAKVAEQTAQIDELMRQLNVQRQLVNQQAGIIAELVGTKAVEALSTPNHVSGGRP